MCAATATDREPFRAWMNLLQAQAVVSEALEARLQAEVDLSLAEHEALARLSSASEGRFRMAELAGLMLVSKSGVTRLVDRLEERQLVERVTCPTDRRVTYAEITPKGRRALERANPVLEAGLADSFGRYLASGDVRTLRRSLRKVLEGNGKWEEERCSGLFRDAAGGAGQTMVPPSAG
jgi:DNA-binding MarR family transcriptional regulator